MSPRLGGKLGVTSVGMCKHKLYCASLLLLAFILYLVPPCQSTFLCTTRCPGTPPPLYTSDQLSIPHLPSLGRGHFTGKIRMSSVQFQTMDFSFMQLCIFCTALYNLQCHWCSYNRPCWKWGGTDDHIFTEQNLC